MFFTTIKTIKKGENKFLRGKRNIVLILILSLLKRLRSYPMHNLLPRVERGSCSLCIMFNIQYSYHPTL